jgi:hypothetical protein
MYLKDAENAMKLAERERAAVERTPLTDETLQTLGPITVSIGVALFPDHSRDMEELIDIADRAMYASKQTGRNRVGLAGCESPRTPAPRDRSRTPVGEWAPNSLDGGCPRWGHRARRGESKRAPVAQVTATPELGGVKNRTKFQLRVRGPFGTLTGILHRRTLAAPPKSEWAPSID